MPLVAAPGSFVEALPGSLGLPPIVQPLGHEVSQLATPGLVVARARAVEAAGGVPLPAPVQRRTSRGAQTASIATAEPSFSSTSPADVEMTASPAASEAGATSTPVRTLPTVSRLTIRMPDRPLTSAAVAARPASVQRSGGHAANGTGASTPAPAALGGMRRVPSAGVPAPSTVSRAAAASTPSAAAVTPAMSVPSPASGSRRGLGAPLDAAPASARPVGKSSSSMPGSVPISRSIAPVAMPLATSARRAPVQREAVGHPDLPGTSTVPSGGHDAAGAAATASQRELPELPVLSLWRSTGAHASSVPATAAAAPATASVPAIRPLLGARPIQPSFHVQRSPAAAGDDDGDDGDGSPDLPRPWWSSGEDQAATAATNSGAGGGAAGSPVVSRSFSGSPREQGAWSPTGPAGARPAPALVAPDVAARPIQRSAARPTALPSVRGQTAVASRQASAPAVAAGTSPAFGPSIVSAPQPAREIVVQTSPAASAMSALRAAGPGSVPVIQREERPASSPSTAAGGHSETDLEELAQALFSRIRTRLRSELIHDREAKGLTFDNV